MEKISRDRHLLRFYKYLFNINEWSMFIKRLISICAISILLFVLWIFPISMFVAPFYSITIDKTTKPVLYKNTIGKTTVNAVKQSITDLLSEGLVTNFVGVKLYIDNKYYEQIGQIEMIRIAINTLENHLARNRGTGGANKYLVQARSDIYADYELSIFTSYSTRIKQASKNIDKYILQLELDKLKDMNMKEAVFIVNSDNLAEVFDKLKQQLQTNIMIKSTFITEDDKFYRLKGNLIAMHKFLNGLDIDFKTKMLDKTSYNENFKPIISLMKNAISQNHLVILESLGHVSKLEKEVNLIAQKLGELRDKLKNG